MIFPLHCGAFLSLRDKPQTPCNHASFQLDPLLYAWCGIPSWDGRILQNNRYFWRKPGLIRIEKYRLVEFVGNPLKISPISCGTPLHHRTNLKTEFTFVVFGICHFSRNTTKGFPCLIWTKMTKKKWFWNKMAAFETKNEINFCFAAFSMK